MSGEAIVGVGSVLCIAHQQKGGGPTHGHSYEVVAWFSEGGNALEHQAALVDVINQIDHSQLNDDLTRAEDIGRWIAARLPGCRVVDVNRPLERIYVCVRP